MLSHSESVRVCSSVALSVPKLSRTQSPCSSMLPAVPASSKDLMYEARALWSAQLGRMFFIGHTGSELKGHSTLIGRGHFSRSFVMLTMAVSVYNTLVG